MQWQPPKTIPDPIYGLIEIRKFLPMIAARAFQALAGRYQLSLTYLACPSATHTRLSHSLGSYWATRMLVERWVTCGFISGEEGDALMAFALYHDIGHPAFSHATEEFCLTDHKAMGVAHIADLSSQIAATGVNYGLVAELAKHENPLHLAVTDKNIGMEKLDYLERDGLFTGHGRPLGISELRNYVYFIDGCLAIDEKVADYAIHAQTFYMEMYKNVYLRKANVITQRMFHKMVWHLISSDELDPSRLPLMSDAELLGIASYSKEPIAQSMYTRLMQRHLFKEAIAIRAHRFACETRIADKPIFVVPVSDEAMRRLTTAAFLQKNNYGELERCEQAIAKLAKIPANAILLVPVFYPERFKVKDVTIYGSDRKFHSLRERRPEHFHAMEETAQSYTALRICVSEEYRSQMNAPQITESISQFLMS